MNGILAYQSEVTDGGVKVTNNRGSNITSKDAEAILKWIAKQPADVNVVYNIQEFYAPILKLLPAHIAQTLDRGQAVMFSGIRLWYGITRHARVIGIRYHEVIQGNIVDAKSTEKAIYDIRQYFTYLADNYTPTLPQLVTMTAELLKTLADMGMPTKDLTSVAKIYKTSTLDKMSIPVYLDMPDETDGAHDMARTNHHEWVKTYREPKAGEKVYSYDLTAAYASAIALMPNLWYAECEHLTEMPPPGHYYGVMWGKVHSKTEVSPLVRLETQQPYVGYWLGTMNTWEYACCYQWDIAEFDMIEGYFINLKKYAKLFEYAMQRLYAYRNGIDPLQDVIAKLASVSVYGKFLELRERNGVEEYGDLYNPIYADMITSLIRVKVTDFIYSHGLQDNVLSVTVDGFKSTEKVAGVSPTRQFGEWRLLERKG